jgi:hypothetical protein
MRNGISGSSCRTMVAPITDISTLPQPWKPAQGTLETTTKIGAKVSQHPKPTVLGCGSQARGASHRVYMTDSPHPSRSLDFAPVWKVELIRKPDAVVQARGAVISANKRKKADNISQLSSSRYHECISTSKRILEVRKRPPHSTLTVPSRHRTVKAGKSEVCKLSHLTYASAKAGRAHGDNYKAKGVASAQLDRQVAQACKSFVAPCVLVLV